MGPARVGALCLEGERRATGFGKVTAGRIANDAGGNDTVLASTAGAVVPKARRSQHEESSLPIFATSLDVALSACVSWACAQHGRGSTCSSRCNGSKRAHR